MRSRFVCVLFIALSASLSLPGWSQAGRPQNVPRNGGDFSDNVQPLNKVPEGVILVKGAWSSASDSVTPVPENGDVINNVFTDQYFGMTYPLPADWAEKYKGPPPSDTGRYVLAQIGPAETYKRPDRGTILITAQDMFFTPLPANNALDLVNYSKDHLQADYKVELPPSPTAISGRPFTFFAYWSPVAQMHWYVLATEIRCHAVQIVLTSRDTKLLENLITDLNRMKLPSETPTATATGGSAFPVCIKDYATEGNVVTRVDPLFAEHKFNAVPVRIVIDQEGKVKHIHFLSAFPDQAKTITDALGQWKFKRHLERGQPVEVETGIMFGRPTYSPTRAASAATE
ncbi:MAG: hypothetical protein WB919_01890 [Candidatus Sulfotelmatobacter sp.]